MKILCDIIVQNNSQPSASVRHGKSTLAIGWHPPNKENSELFLMLFSSKNKLQGTKFKVKGNLEKVFSRFVAEGKVTLSFKEPDQSLQIKTDPIQLKSFMSTLKLAMDCGKNERNKIGLSTVAVTPISQKAHPVTKMTILSRGEYPTKGLPRTLTYLGINGIKRCRVDMQITFLKQLVVLNLSDNCITKIPKPIGEMRLQEIDFSKNDLGNDTEGCDWKWLGGFSLQRSLKTLNLSSNKIKYFPLGLVKMMELGTLKMDNNLLERIPFAVRKMDRLRNLTLSGNFLKSLPNSLEKLRLESLDVSNNLFNNVSYVKNDPQNFVVGCPTLFELSARIVEKRRLPYSNFTLPWDVVDFLSVTPMCNCGQICTKSPVYNQASPIRLNCSSVTSDPSIIFVDCVFCSLECCRKRVK